MINDVEWWIRRGKSILDYTKDNWESHKLDQETLLKIPGGEIYSDTCTNKVFWKRMKVPSKAPFQRKKTVRGEKRKKRRSLREKGRHLDGEHVHKRRWCGKGIVYRQ